MKNKYKLIFGILLLITLIASINAQELNYIEVQSHGNGANDIFPIDLDDNGLIDLVYGSGAFSGSWIWLNNTGDLNFDGILKDSSETTIYSIYSADIDDDGDNDVIVGRGTGGIKWYQNDGSETFSEFSIAGGNGFIERIQIVDLDEDGDKDFVTWSQDSGSFVQVEWFENNGAESFTPHTILSGELSGEGGAVIDLDGDNDLDILYSQSSPNTIGWLQNDGSENFVNITIDSCVQDRQTIDPVDLDEDGDIDLITGCNNFTWYENDGSENFTPNQIINKDMSLSGIGDLDEDGDIDIVSRLHGSSQGFYYINDGSETFTEYNLTNSFGTSSGTKIVVNDFNNDGILEIHSTGNPHQLFENQGQYFFYESFKNFDWELNNTNNCTTGDYVHNSIISTSDKISLTYDWSCWANNNNNFFDVFYTDSNILYNTLNSLSLFTSVAITGYGGFKHTSFLNVVDEFDLTENDSFEFYCRNQNLQDDGGNESAYLIFGNETDNSFVLNLGTSTSYCGVDTSNFNWDYDERNLSQNCCKLSDITSFSDSCSGSFHKVNLSISQIISSCSGITTDNFRDLTKVELFTSSNNQTGGSWYFDDLKISKQLENYTQPFNFLPFGLTVNSTPDYTLINETIQWEVIMSDVDDLNSEIYSAFDCENDGVQEYNLLQRGEIVTYNCTYSVAGNYTGNVTMTDVIHFGSENSSATDETVEIQDNNLPFLIFANAIQNQAEVNTTVQWSVSIADDGLSSQIYSAFDCENDGVQEYVMAQRGAGVVYNCTYTLIGNFTANVTMTDPFHFGTSNSTGKDETVEILYNITSPSQPIQGGNCISFTDTSPCTGDCFFNDNFDYIGYPVSCKNWQGSGNVINPTNNEFAVFNLPVTIFEIYQNELISETTYNNFTIEFDFTLNSDTIWQFDILDGDLSDYVALITFENYVVKAYDQTAPTINTLGTVTNGTQHNLRMYIDFVSNEITYYFDDVAITTGEFFDNDAQSSSKFTLSWTSNGNDFEVDNFQIFLGTTNPNVTEEYEIVDYTYDPDFFCAINWATEPPTFSIPNCESRGFAVNGSRLGFCMPRACFQDVGLSIFAWAMNNILFTIVVVLVIILLVPIFVAMIKK